MVAAHSHLFFFFPVFGILALAAFYLPSVIFVDLYWRHLPYGKLRFLIGLVAMAGLAYIVSTSCSISRRALSGRYRRTRSPPTRASHEAAVAAPVGGPPTLAVLANLRKEGQNRLGLSKFARTCEVDPMLEVPEEMDKERHCFPATAKLKGNACCEVQRRFRAEISNLQADPRQRSLSGTYDQIFLPLKTFFMVIVVAIGGLLAFQRDQIDRHYGELVHTLERGVIIGGLAMLFWPIMDYGYQQTANVLFGRLEAGTQLRFSLVIVPWALLLLFYFLRRLGKQGEMIGQIAGVVTAAVAVLRFEDLNDWAVRLLGIGTNMWIIGALIALAVVGFVGLIRPFRGVPGPLGSPSASS